MKKVFISIGHGGKDTGAVGYVVEKNANLCVGLSCNSYLSKRGVKTQLSREKDENDPVQEEIRECNNFDPDLAVSIHSNAGGGIGFEAYYHYRGGTSKKLAENIEDEVIKIGQKSRGVKIRRNSQGSDYYAFIRETKCPAVICEGFFVDNKEDSENYNESHEYKKLGESYAKGILKTLGIKDEDDTEEIKVGDKVKVLKNVQYNSDKTFKLWFKEYDVISVNGDRVVIGIKDSVTAAVNICNIEKIKY